MPEFTKIRTWTWTEHLGRSGLCSFTDQQNHFWLEQNSSKTSKWAKLARQGHEIAWEFESPGGPYTGRGDEDVFQRESRPVEVNGLTAVRNDVQAMQTGCWCVYYTSFVRVCA